MDMILSCAGGFGLLWSAGVGQPVLNPSRGQEELFVAVAVPARCISENSYA